MSISVTFTFESAADAAAFLAAKTTGVNPAPGPSSIAQTPAPTPAAQVVTHVAQVAAQVASLDFERDVVSALQALAKKINRDQFGKLMTTIGVTKVPEIAGKQSKWQAIINFCNEPNEANYKAIAAA